MDAETLKQLGQGGFAMALLGLVYMVGMRLIKAIDRLIAKLDEHTRIDIEHHEEVKESYREVSDAITDLRARFDVIQDITPVDSPVRRTRTGPRGVPVGYYGPHRPKTHGEDE